MVALYTLEEKINATSSGSPGVERLGIPPYQWWSEGLHGIAGPYTNFSDSGEYSYSTSFPQPITMGAAFDDALITEVAKVISIEARAFNNANRTGLDFWVSQSPKLEYLLALMTRYRHPISTLSETLVGDVVKRPPEKTLTIFPHMSKL